MKLRNLRALFALALLTAAGAVSAAPSHDYVMKFEGENALVEHTMRPTVSAAGEILEAAVGMHEYFREIQPTLSKKPYVDLVVNWTAMVRNQAGESMQAPAVQLRFKSDALQKIKFSEVSPQGLLNEYVVNVGSSKLGKEMLMEFCEKYAQTTPKFCQKAARS